MALIKYIEFNKKEDNDWVKIEATNKEQTKYIYICMYNNNRWKGKCWYIHNLVRYDFDLQFEVNINVSLIKDTSYISIGSN